MGSGSSSMERQVTIEAAGSTANSGEDPRSVPRMQSYRRGSAALPPGIPNGPFRWEVQAIGETSLHSGFSRFSAQNNERLEEAFKARQQECNVVISKRLYSVDVRRMEMKPCGGAKQIRRVRRVVDDEGKSNPFADFFVSESSSSASFGEVRQESSLLTAASAPAGTEHLAPNFCAVLKSTTRAHEASVFSLCQTLNGEKVVTVSKDGVAKFWELDTGYVVVEFEEHPGAILCSSIAKTDKLVATGCEDECARLFTIPSPDPVVLEGHTHKVYGVQFTCDSKQLITGSMDGDLRLWDISGGKCVRTVKAHAEPLFSVSSGVMHPWLALTASDDTTCVVHDLRTNHSQTAVLRGHKKTLWGCDIRFDEQQYGTCSMDKTVCIWDARSNEKPLRIISHHLSPVHSVEFMPDERLVLTCSRDRTFKLTDGVTGQLMLSVNAHDGSVYKANCNAMRNRIVTCGSDGIVKMWSYCEDS